MNKIEIILFLILTFNMSCIHKNIEKKSNFSVIDTVTAIKIAELNWIKIYGKDVINEKPYSIKLQGDSIWVINGTLPKNVLGGVAYIEIRKCDGKILKVTHGK